MNHSLPLILASTSPYRRELLARLGFAFDCIAPDCDESAWKSRGLAPSGLARELAREKAGSVARHHPEAVVVGSDQVCCLEGRVLGKPGTRAAAIEQLLLMQGRSHELATAVCVVCNAVCHEFIDFSRLVMRALSRPQIERYVDADSPLDCAGSYKIEKRGIALFETIDSADATAITGLPLLQLNTLLLRLR